MSAGFDMPSLARAVLLQAWRDAFSARSDEGRTIPVAREAWRWLTAPETSPIGADRDAWAAMAGVSPRHIRSEALARAAEFDRTMAERRRRLEGLRARRAREAAARREVACG